MSAKKKFFLITTFILIAAVIIVLFTGYITRGEAAEYDGTLVNVEMCWLG